MTDPAPEQPGTTWALTFTASGTVGQGTAPDPIEQETP